METKMSNEKKTVHMKHTAYGTVLCGMKGTMTDNEDDVNCAQCERMMMTGHYKEPVKEDRKEPTPISKPKKVDEKRAKQRMANLKKNQQKKPKPFCLCGCGEQTKGGRFKPGHDAKYHSAQKEKEHPRLKKNKSTGNHRMDTILGAIRHL